MDGSLTELTSCTLQRNHSGLGMCALDSLWYPFVHGWICFLAAPLVENCLADWFCF